MNRAQGVSPLMLLGFVFTGTGVGLFVQALRSIWGLPPLTPPLSLSLTLGVIAIVLLSLGVALRRALAPTSTKTVNPFHAVRILAGARASQCVGALLGGCGGGLVLQLLSRSVMPSTGVWLPMLLVCGTGVLLLVCGVYVERCCRVPPGENERDRGSMPGEGENAEPEPDSA